MKYAVIYQSQNGNTERIADEIYRSLSAEDKVICDLNRNSEIPEADVYFIGFGIRNGHCSIDVIRCFEQITGGHFALFITCGYAATEKYKTMLKGHLDVWMPENADYLGMFLCQGRIELNQQEIMLDNMPEKSDQLMKLFEMGNTHPDYGDFQNAARFARDMQRKVEHNGNILVK